MYTGFLRESQKSTTLGTILGRKRSAKSKQPILTIRRASCFGSCTPAGYPPARGAPPATRGPSATHFPATSRSVRRAKKSCKRQKTRFPFCWHHRENQSAEAAAINTVCKPRRPAGGFFVSEFAPISLTKPFQKERCCLDSSILFGKVL